MKLKLDWATYESAKYAGINWHYSKCIPVGKLIKIGVWENDKFIGVIIFSRGACRTLGDQFGLKQTEICELTRVALTKHKTPVSRIMMIAFKLLKTLIDIKCVVSFADPSQGHHGGIYQATNWIYTGLIIASYKVLVNGVERHNRGFDRKTVKLRQAKGEDIKIVKNTSKHRYVMPLYDEIKPFILNLSKPYPKRATKANSGVQLECGGAIPTGTLQI